MDQKEAYNKLINTPLRTDCIRTVWDTMGDATTSNRWDCVIQANKKFVSLFLSLAAKYTNLDDIRVILDIGSLNGIEAIYMAQLLPKCTVYSFEAHPKSFLHVKDNQKDFANIHQYNVAISNHVGEVDFYITTDNVGASSVLRPTGGYAGTAFNKIKVSCTTVNQFCADNNIDKIDLIWMDLQGNELNALKGADKYLGRLSGICSEVGLVPYYEHHALYPEINAYLNSFSLTREENIQWTHNHNVGDLEDDVMYFRR